MVANTRKEMTLPAGRRWRGAAQYLAARENAFKYLNARWTRRGIELTNFMPFVKRRYNFPPTSCDFFFKKLAFVPHRFDELCLCLQNAKFLFVATQQPKYCELFAKVFLQCQSSLRRAFPVAIRVIKAVHINYLLRDLFHVFSYFSLLLRVLRRDFTFRKPSEYLLAIERKKLGGCKRR